MLHRRLLVAVLLAVVTPALNEAASAAASPAATATYTFGADSLVTYTLVHPAHTVVGESHALKGTVTLVADKLATPLTLSIPAISFNSGNKNRDANAAFALGADRYPTIKLAIASFTEKSRSGGKGAPLKLLGTAHGKLTLHGVTNAISVPLEATVTADSLMVDGAFEVSLTAHKIDRPSLLTIQTEDKVTLAVHGVAKAN